MDIVWESFHKFFTHHISGGVSDSSWHKEPNQRGREERKEKAPIRWGKGKRKPLSQEGKTTLMEEKRSSSLGQENKISKGKGSQSWLLLPSKELSAIWPEHSSNTKAIFNTQEAHSSPSTASRLLGRGVWRKRKSVPKGIGLKTLTCTYFSKKAGGRKEGEREREWRGGGKRKEERNNRYRYDYFEQYLSYCQWDFFNCCVGSAIIVGCFFEKTTLSASILFKRNNNARTSRWWPDLTNKLKIIWTLLTIL